MKRIGSTILITLLILVIVRSCFFDIYQIDGSSMTTSLLHGDRVVVSKLSYGYRVPRSLKFPIVDHNSGFFKFFDIKLYSGFFGEYKRMPGISEISINDLVVFNSPVPKSIYEVNEIFDKRVMALPGDTISISDGMTFINRHQASNDFGVFGYRIITRVPISDEIASDWGIKDFNRQIFALTNPLNKDLFEYMIYIARDQEERIRKSVSVVSVERRKSDSFSDQQVFPYWLPFGWNRDNYGPLVMPSQGFNITIDSANLHKYFYLIKYYEGHKNVEIKAEKLFIEGLEATRYSFINNFYFVLGDNRDSSIDSRYFGPVPESHIVGKIVLVVFSRGSNGIRWDRIFRHPNSIL